MRAAGRRSDRLRRRGSMPRARTKGLDVGVRLVGGAPFVCRRRVVCGRQPPESVAVAVGRFAEPRVEMADRQHSSEPPRLPDQNGWREDGCSVWAVDLYFWAGLVVVKCLLYV